MSEENHIQGEKRHPFRFPNLQTSRTRSKSPKAWIFKTALLDSVTEGRGVKLNWASHTSLTPLGFLVTGKLFSGGGGEKAATAGRLGEPENTGPKAARLALHEAHKFTEFSHQAASSGWRGQRGVKTSHGSPEDDAPPGRTMGSAQAVVWRRPPPRGAQGPAAPRSPRSARSPAPRAQDRTAPRALPAGASRALACPRSGWPAASCG